MKDLEYEIEQLATERIVLPRHFTNHRVFIQESDPYFREMRMSMIAYIASRKLDTKEVVFYPLRQSFWDYLLRREPKPFKVMVSAKDVLKDIPDFPKTHDVIRIYDIEKISITDPN